MPKKRRNNAWMVIRRGNSREIKWLVIDSDRLEIAVYNDKSCCPQSFEAYLTQPDPPWRLAYMDRCCLGVSFRVLDSSGKDMIGHANCGSRTAKQVIDVLLDAKCYVNTEQFCRLYRGHSHLSR